MRDVALAPAVTPPLTGGLADSVFQQAERNPALPVLARRAGPAAGWQEVTAVELRDEVVDLAKGLIAAGISPGHRVALMARTRYEWTVLAHALWTVGAEVVPIHPGSARDQVEWILRDTGCVAVVVEDEQGVMTVGTVCTRLPRLRHVWQLDAGALPDLVEQGAAVPYTTVESLRRIVLPDATAAIVHTSGSSGRPLGCALSHRGLAYPCDTLLAGWVHTAAPPGAQPSVLAFLPFSHVYGIMIMLTCVRGGVLMAHEPEPTETALASALATFRPTYLYGVPSVFEKLYKTFLRTAQQAGRGALFERAAQTARDFAAAEERRRLGTGPGPGLELRLQHALYERTVYRRLRAALGGRVVRGTSGGSALSRELGLFFEGIGVFVNDGYGLTESSGGITMQPLGREKSGTVGLPLPGTEIQVADDGEILVRGPSVFQGYIGDEQATRAALRGGWLATGDIGRLDPEGYLTITGRKKDIIVTSGGKSVAPAPAGAAAAHASAGAPGGGDRRRPALRRRPDHPGPGVPRALADRPGAAGRRPGPRDPGGECAAGGDRAGRGLRQQCGVPRGVHQGLPCPPGTVRTGQRAAHPVLETAPGRRRAALHGRDRGDVPGALPGRGRFRRSRPSGTNRTMSSAEGVRREDGRAEGEADSPRGRGNPQRSERSAATTALVGGTGDRPLGARGPGMRDGDGAALGRDTPPSEESYERTFSFPGELRNVTGARHRRRRSSCARSPGTRHRARPSTGTTSCWSSPSWPRTRSSTRRARSTCGCAARSTGCT